MSKNNTPAPKLGDVLYNQMDKINPELFSLTYGAFVMQLLRDHQDPEVVNTELYKIGYNMGVRMIDEFFAKSNIEACIDFSETVSVVANIAFKMFLGVDAEVVKAASDRRTYQIAFKNNPLIDFVELPQGLDRLVYSNIICGVITGALRMLSIVVECTYLQDPLKGSSLDVIQIKLIEVINEGYLDDDV